MSFIVRASWAGPPALGLIAVLDRKRIGEARGRPASVCVDLRPLMKEEAA